MLFKKCLRDIKLNKSQFLNIFIMVFLGVFVFAGIHSYMDGMRVSGEKFYENINKLEETKANIENKIDSALAVTTRDANVSYVTLNSEI